jgi:hypothetical protein
MADRSLNGAMRPKQRLGRMAVGGHELGGAANSTILTELLSFLDELLAYLESARDVQGDDGRPARRSLGIERLTKKTRALRDAVSLERQKH